MEAKVCVQHEDAVDAFFDHPASRIDERRAAFDPNEFAGHDVANSHVAEFFKAECRQRDAFPTFGFWIEVIDRFALAGCAGMFLFVVKNVAGRNQSDAAGIGVHNWQSRDVILGH